MKKFFLIFSVLSFFFINTINAEEKKPEVYFRTTHETFAPGSEFTVGVFVNSESPINAFHLEIGFSPQTLEFVNYNTNFSFVEFWRRDPEVFEDGIIKIEGGTSKPFIGTSGEILKLNFKVKKEGLGQWSFRVADFYYADGLGTLAETSRVPMTVSFSNSAPFYSLDKNDKQSPVIAGLEISRNPVDNSRIAVFEVNDMDSGLKTTFLRTRNLFFWNNWEKAINPIRLASGIWSFQLKAVDNEGNSAIRTFYLKDEIIKKILYFFSVIILALIVFFITKKFRVRNKLL